MAKTTKPTKTSVSKKQVPTQPKVKYLGQPATKALHKKRIDDVSRIFEKAAAALEKLGSVPSYFAIWPSYDKDGTSVNSRIMCNGLRTPLEKVTMIASITIKVYTIPND